MEDETIKKIWADTLVILKEKIANPTYDLWIAPLVPHSFEDGRFCVLTAQSLAVPLIQRNNKEIMTALSEVTGREVNFSVQYDEEVHKNFEKERKKQSKDDEVKEFISALEKNIEKSKYDGLKQMQSPCNLNLKYKFENFIVGPGNKFAYAVSETVAKEPGKKYNPLFIYGGSGLGKTHLMQAIGHYIMFNKPKKKIKYVKSEEFMNDLIDSLRQVSPKTKSKSKTENMNNFRDKYRNVDVLLIDDIQFLEGKEQTQVELFNTFNTLHDAGKQIVLTSDREPDKLEKLDERLKTRFQQGILADVQIPDLETRMAILLKLCSDNNIRMPGDVVEFLAKIYNKNVRELEGVFNKVTAYSSINEIPVTLENVKQIINYKEERKNVTIEGIIDITAGYYNVSSEDIKGTSRFAKIANARQIALYLAKELTDESYPSVGSAFNRKHTTVMYAHDQVKKNIAGSLKLAKEIKELTDKINE